MTETKPRTQSDQNNFGRLITAGSKSENNTSESNVAVEDGSQLITNDLVHAISR